MRLPQSKPHPFAWLLLFSLLMGCAQEPPKFNKPPIILIDIDTLRADHLGCYGYERDTSPHIDRFASEAARFEWVFSQAPNTPPSQSSILTSLYPTSHGRIGNEQVINEGVETLAEVLQRAGYQTAAFVDGGLMAAGFGLEQGFEIYNDEAGGLRHIGPKAKHWVSQQLGQSREDGTPFFLLVHTYDVHSPYENSPEPYRSMFLDGFELPPAEYRNNMSKNMAQAWKARNDKPAPKLDQAELDYAIAMYDSGIRFTDDWFAEFREFLEAEGIWDQAIIALISDHGDTFQEHGALFHEQIYAAVSRIPLIIRLPGSKEGGVFDPVVESIDLMPTLLDAVDIETPEMAQGQSLLPWIEGRPETARTANVAITESPYRGRRLALATDRHRLLLTRQTGQAELYRYREDPLEQQDVATEEAETTERLSQALERWEQKVSSFSFDAEEIQDLDEETVEQLRTLGYID